MDITEIEEQFDEAAEILSRLAKIIKPMVPEDCHRDDDMLAAWSVTGGAARGARIAKQEFQRAVKRALGRL